MATRQRLSSEQAYGVQHDPLLRNSVYKHGTCMFGGVPIPRGGDRCCTWIWVCWKISQFQHEACQLKGGTGSATHSFKRMLLTGSMSSHSLPYAIRLLFPFRAARDALWARCFELAFSHFFLNMRSIPSFKVCFFVKSLCPCRSPWCLSCLVWTDFWFRHPFLARPAEDDCLDEDYVNGRSVNQTVQGREEAMRL